LALFPLLLSVSSSWRKTSRQCHRRPSDQAYRPAPSFPACDGRDLLARAKAGLLGCAATTPFARGQTPQLSNFATTVGNFTYPNPFCLNKLHVIHSILPFTLIKLPTIPSVRIFLDDFYHVAQSWSNFGVRQSNFGV
jgi:hypothetical protein